MAAKQRRECEPVAVRVAAVGAATLGIWKKAAGLPHRHRNKPAQ